MSGYHGNGVTCSSKCRISILFFNKIANKACWNNFFYAASKFHYSWKIYKIDNSFYSSCNVKQILHQHQAVFSWRFKVFFYQCNSTLNLMQLYYELFNLANYLHNFLLFLVLHNLKRKKVHHTQYMSIVCGCKCCSTAIICLNWYILINFSDSIIVYLQEYSINLLSGNIRLWFQN